MRQIGELVAFLRGKVREDAPQAPIAPDPIQDDLRFQVDRLRAEWNELQLHWAEVLDKITAWSNRQAARDRKAFGKSMSRLAEGTDAPAEVPGYIGEPPSISPADTKQELRRRAAALYRRA